MASLLMYAVNEKEEGRQAVPQMFRLRERR